MNSHEVFYRISRPVLVEPGGEIEQVNTFAEIIYTS